MSVTAKLVNEVSKTIRHNQLTLIKQSPIIIHKLQSNLPSEVKSTVSPTNNLNNGHNGLNSNSNIKSSKSQILHGSKQMASSIVSSLNQNISEESKNNNLVSRLSSNVKPSHSLSINTGLISTNIHNPPTFFKKLCSYFPKHEMKKLEHFMALLKDKPHSYKVDESNDHVVVYSLIDKYLFVDYVWVSENARGKGLGGKIIQMLKSFDKCILLEVEGIEAETAEWLKNNLATKDQLSFSKEMTQKIDAVKRLKFYKREGFRHANEIQYSRKAGKTGESYSMEILYWKPEDSQISQSQLLEAMKKFYNEIHKYKDEEIYGWEFEEATAVVELREPIQDLLSLV